MKSFVLAVFSFPSKLINFFNMKRKHVAHGRRLSVSGLLSIHGEGKIVIGNDVTINSSHRSNPIGGDTHTHLRAINNGTIVIGDHVGISNSAIVAADRVEIENNVLIGAGCKIYDTDFHSIYLNDRMARPEINIKTAPVHISEGAFIGAHSILLKGVTIGRQSVVGAGSVVTKSIPDFEVWGGNPAAFIKKLQ